MHAILGFWAIWSRPIPSACATSSGFLTAVLGRSNTSSTLVFLPQSELKMGQLSFNRSGGTVVAGIIDRLPNKASRYQGK